MIDWNSFLTSPSSLLIMMSSDALVVLSFDSSGCNQISFISQTNSCPSCNFHYVASICPYTQSGACDDLNPCTYNDQCIGTQCVGTEINCSTNLSCHYASCNGSTGQCEVQARSDGYGCNDGNACTVNDTCISGICNGTGQLNCTSTNTCEVGTCNTSVGCIFTSKANGTNCNDGNICTDNDQCNSGTCSGTWTNCPQYPNLCVLASCIPPYGCTNYSSPNGTQCNDNNACTTSDQCEAGICAGTGFLPCNSSVNPCYNNTCLPRSGCLDICASSSSGSGGKNQLIPK